MGDYAAQVEKACTTFFATSIRTTCFFLTGEQQSCLMTFLHYFIFAIGFYYFFFHSKPGDIGRVLFFIFVLFAALLYYILNKCIFTSVERLLSDKQNLIQNAMCAYFGESVEGNVSSKRFLTGASIVLGGILCYDYIMLNTYSDREYGSYGKTS